VKVLGVITTTLTSAVAVLAAVIVLRSLPDIRRYLKMRSM
jgi:hypothetical protein